MKGCRIKKGGVFLLMLAVLVISRSLFLDSDIPLPAVTEYCAIDEMYYNHAAFNLYHYGEYAHRVVPYVNDVGVNNNILENLLTFFTLATWGNTYYGLRMASVAASALIFAMLWYVLAGGRKKRETMPSQPEHGETVGGDAALAAAAGEEPGTASRCPRSRLPLSLWMLMLIGYLLVDFPFLVAGRVAEPTIFRILALAVLLCLLAAAERRGRLGSPCTSFFLGLLSLGCVLFVYLYNAFVFAAAAASVVAWHWRKGGRVVLRHLGFFAAGAGLALFGYAAFVSLVLGGGAEIINGLAPYSYRLIGRNTGHLALLKHFFMNFLAVFSTNIFRLNIALLFIFLVSLPVLVKRAFREKEPLVVLLCNLLLFLVLQCVVINDFNFRKLLIIEPLLIIQLFYVFSYIPAFRRTLALNPRGGKLYRAYWLVIGCFFVFFMHLGSIKPVQLNTDIIINAQAVLPAVFNRINLAVFVVVFLTVTLYFWGKRKMKEAWLAIAFILILVPSLYLDACYVYTNQTYNFRDTMVELKDKVDGKVVAGGVAYGFRLYNDMMPVLDFYRFAESKRQDAVGDYIKILKRLFAEGRAEYSLQFPMKTKEEEEKYAAQRGMKVEKRYKMVTLYRHL